MFIKMFDEKMFRMTIFGNNNNRMCTVHVL